MYVLLSILCVRCLYFVLCIVSPLVHSCLFSICVQFYRPLPPGGNPIAVNKYIIPYTQLRGLLPASHPSGFYEGGGGHRLRTSTVTGKWKRLYSSGPQTSVFRLIVLTCQNDLGHVYACFYFGIRQVWLDSHSARSRKPRLRFPHPHPQFQCWNIHRTGPVRSGMTIVFLKQDQLQQAEGLNHYKIFL